MEKENILKIKPLYTRDEFISFLDDLNNDSKKISADAEEKIKSHILNFVEQLRKGLVNIYNCLQCFRAKQNFYIENVERVHLFKNEILDHIEVENSLIAFYDSKNNLIISYEIDDLFDEDYLIKFMAKAKAHVISVLKNSIAHMYSEIERFQKDLNIINDML